VSKPLTIAIDAMGGDGGAPMAVGGTALLAKRDPELRFLLFGKREEIEPLVAMYPALKDRAEIIHTDLRVSAADKPSHVVRRGQESSMGLAIHAVKDGRAEAAISAGNTGAMLALSKIMLRTMPGIDRPALATSIPARDRDLVMLDLGANVECQEENLIQFAVMGAAYARTVMKVEKPRVGLLNVGVEDQKGNEKVRNAGRRLKDSSLPMEFAGFTEGDGIGTGAMDVVVTDGFTGNIALKTAEGTAKLISSLFRQAFQNSIMAQIGALFALRQLRRLKAHLDPNNHNGAVFLGLNGLVVKSHGNATPKGFSQAILTGVDMARYNLIRLITEDLKNFEGHSEKEPRAAASQ
jgi:phosphate acyltransferase